MRNQILSSSLAYLIIFLLVYCVYKNSEVSLLYYSLNKNLFIFGLLIHTTIFYFKRQSGVYIIRIPEFYWSHCWVPSLTYTIVALNFLHEPHIIYLLLSLMNPIMCLQFSFMNPIIVSNFPLWTALCVFNFPSWTPLCAYKFPSWAPLCAYKFSLFEWTPW